MSRVDYSLTCSLTGTLTHPLTWLLTCLLPYSVHWSSCYLLAYDCDHTVIMFATSCVWKPLQFRQHGWLLFGTQWYGGNRWRASKYYRSIVKIIDLCLEILTVWSKSTMCTRISLQHSHNRWFLFESHDCSYWLFFFWWAACQASPSFPTSWRLFAINRRLEAACGAVFEAHTHYMGHLSYIQPCWLSGRGQTYAYIHTRTQNML